jgi:hypothetical protein
LKFSFPFEHGAWWTFQSCLAAGLFQAIAWKAPLFPSACLALGMECLFLASEWVAGFGRSLVEGRLGGDGQFRSRKGWILSALGLGLLGLGVDSLAAELRSPLMGVLGFWAAFSLSVLWMRIKLPSRDIVLLMGSAVLLTGPALVLGGLAFSSFSERAAEFWSLWAWSYAWGVFYIQAWMRGSTLPRWRLALASLPFLIQAAFLSVHSGLGVKALLLLLSLRILWRLKRRMENMGEPLGSPQTPTSPAEIRLLGYEQLAWSLLLGVSWSWHFLPGK